MQTRVAIPTCGICVVAVLLLPRIASRDIKVLPRNLLLITLDTMRADRLPVYGFSGIETPTLDRLAAGGAVFQQAFAAAPLTLPSHAALFTGLLPPQTGIRDNASPPLGDEFTTLAEVLRDSGRKTAAFIGSSVLTPSRGLGQGFDSFSEPTTACGGPPRRRASAVVDDALGWFASTTPSPFFAWVHLFDTHQPYDLPDDFKNRHFDQYLAAIAYEDVQIGRLVAYLDAGRLLSHTLIVVAGDHGESLGDHGEKTHGIFLYEEALRVPLIIHGGGVPAVRHVTPVARLIDIMPTVLELLGLPAPRMNGGSLVGVEAESVRETREVYAEAMYPLRFGWSAMRSLRADRFKFIDAPRAELYDLHSDPGEQRNVIRSYPGVADAMHRRLRAIDPVVNAASPSFQEVEPAHLKRIGALGYVSGTRRQAMTDTDLPDPKDHIEEFNKLTTHQLQEAAFRRSMCR